MKIRRTILGIIAVIALLSACNADSTASEEELIDDFDEEFAEEIFDDMPIISDTEISETDPDIDAGTTEIS